MSMSDPIGDLFTRIRNGQKAKLAIINAPASRFGENVLRVLKDEGFIRDFKRIETGNKADLEVQLKYPEGKPAIQTIERVSKPGRRVYSAINSLKKYYNGLGIYIVSTPKGLMSDRQAREENVGGEVVGRVF